MIRWYPSILLVTIAPCLLPVTLHAFCIPKAKTRYLGRQTVFSTSNSQEESDEDSPKITITSFDQAGASLIEEEDRKRMEAMGDFDVNPNVSHSGGSSPKR
jgi:hypothetical protein